VAKRPQKTIKARKPQPPWLQQGRQENPPPPPSPERTRAMPLLTKAEVLAITRCSYPTLWLWMNAGTFPRSRVLGGKSLWMRAEVEAWLDKLPVRRLKVDTNPVEAT
jgi:predicted DNA-binding transcriptional regulator AlpA